MYSIKSTGFNKNACKALVKLNKYFIGEHRERSVQSVEKLGETLRNRGVLGRVE